MISFERKNLFSSLTKNIMSKIEKLLRNVAVPPLNSPFNKIIFLDVYALCPGDKIRVMKLLSVDPANYPDAPRYQIIDKFNLLGTDVG